MDVGDDPTIDDGTDSNCEAGVSTTGVPPTGVAAEMDAKYRTRQQDGLRARKAPRSPARIKKPQSSAHPTLNTMLGSELSGIAGFSDLEHVALTQYNLRCRLKLYGKAAADAVVNEMKQLHDRKTIRPRYIKDLTLDEKRKVLAYLMFKERRCGTTVKGRGFADEGSSGYIKPRKRLLVL